MVDGVTTTFTMDISTFASTSSAQRLNAGLNTSLTQALSDGTHDYVRVRVFR